MRAFFLKQPLRAAERFLRNCDNYNSDYERFCEVRDVTLKAPQQRLFIDGRDNGGVAFYGWDKNEVLVRALIQGTGDITSRSTIPATARARACYTTKQPLVVVLHQDISPRSGTFG